MSQESQEQIPPVQVHTSAALEEMWWTCPVCGAQHRASVWPLLIANDPATTYTCGAVTYTIHTSRLVLGRLKSQLQRWGARGP